MNEAALAAVMSRAIDFGRNSCEQSTAMRHLMAILGVFAILVTLSGPVAALAVSVPCHDAMMAKMTMAGDGMATCTPTAKTCAAPCVGAGSCQSHCGFVPTFVQIDCSDFALPHLSMSVQVLEDEQPPGTDSPVDGPPPRF